MEILTRVATHQMHVIWYSKVYLNQKCFSCSLLFRCLVTAFVFFFQAYFVVFSPGNFANNTFPVPGWLRPYIANLWREL